MHTIVGFFIVITLLGCPMQAASAPFQFDMPNSASTCRNDGPTGPGTLAQLWDGKLCCEQCCLDGQLKKNCSFMEANKCRARGGVCYGQVVPFFGRD
ncbi:MAG: hypothetical protein V2B18_00600 [Pseudomonadota bacterium]